MARPGLLRAAFFFLLWEEPGNISSRTLGFFYQSFAAASCSATARCGNTAGKYFMGGAAGQLSSVSVFCLNGLALHGREIVSKFTTFTYRKKHARIVAFYLHKLFGWPERCIFPIQTFRVAGVLHFIYIHMLFNIENVSTLHAPFS